MGRSRAHVRVGWGRERVLADSLLRERAAAAQFTRVSMTGLRSAWQRGDTVTASTERVGVYPGSFNPPTVAHIEIALTAREQHRLERGSTSPSRWSRSARRPWPRNADRRAVGGHRGVGGPGRGPRPGRHRTSADRRHRRRVRRGGDGRRQVGPGQRRRVVSRPRPPATPRSPPCRPWPSLPGPWLRGTRTSTALPVAADLLDVSSSAVRAGRTEWMTDAARRHHERHGTWR